MMTNVIVTLVILAIIAGSIAMFVREKRKGVKCVGCPYCEAKGNDCRYNNLK